MKTIGIKLADGSFYPVLEEGSPKSRQLDLTTVNDGQTKVLVDLYRSESGTMDDAEYVDTLEVSNLVSHPNGEVELRLSLGLDENNELKATVHDKETGNHHELNINLVSRPSADRELPADFAINESESEGALQTDEDAQDEQIANEEPAEEPTEEIILDTGFADDTDDFEEKSEAEDVPFTVFPDSLPAETDDITEEISAPTDDTFADSVPTKDTDSGEIAGSVPAEDETDTDSTVADDAETDDTTEEETDSFEASDIADEEDDTGTFEDFVSAAELFALAQGTKEDANALEEQDTDAPKTEPESVTEEDFSLPDFDDAALFSSGISSQPQQPSSTETAGLTGFFEDSAFDSLSDSKFDSAENFDSDFAMSGKDDFQAQAATPAMDFSDLYDEETLDGKSDADYSEEKKKTRTPVIICVICAIICVLATILVLFIVPSKYNLIKSRNTHFSASTEQQTFLEKTPAQTESSENEGEFVPDNEVYQVTELEESLETEEEEPEITAPDAEENKIVLSPTPEVVPVPQPEPEPEKQKQEAVKYRIKWGDTLWDLADSYYKNPWRYPKIARYNNIKNPNLIISGTDIFIPVE